MWKYESPIGSIFIVPLADGNFGMEYNGIIWESCPTPEAEADNVYMQSTGCSDWDLFNTTGYYVPQSLSEWEEV